LYLTPFDEFIQSLAKEFNTEKGEDRINNISKRNPEYRKIE
jgi:hypothetical protein